MTTIGSSPAQPSATEVTKTVARGQRGVAVSHNVEAAAVGARVLEEGGTAIDATIAMSLTAAVRETAMTGIGGAGVLLAYDARQASTVEINFYGRTPASLPEDVFVPYLLPPASPRMEFGWCGTSDNVSQRGFLSVGVPAYVAGIEAACGRLATMPLKDLIAPAIGLAKTGFEFDEEDTVFLASFSSLLETYAEARRIYLPDGLAAATSRRFVQPDLARTLQMLASEGMRSFYEGSFAERLVDHVASGGGFLTMNDMEQYRPAVGSGLRGTYRGFDVVTADGAMGGVTLLEMLNLAEQFDLRSMGHNSTQYLHLLAEIIRQAWTDRFLYVADPESNESPIDGLVTKDYARSVIDNIPKTSAAKETCPGNPWRYSRYNGGLSSTNAGERSSSHTTSLAAADADGNVATVTQTLGQCYGSCVGAPNSGVLVYDLTYWLNPAPGTPNSVGPWKRPAGHSTPVLLFRDGRPVAAMGAPGGRKIVTSLFQVIVNMVDFGMDIQDAIAAPRIHLEGVDPARPDAPPLPDVDVDYRVDPRVIQQMQRLGHRVTSVRDSATRIRFGRPLGVEFADEALLGGVDIHGKSVGIGV